MHGKNTRLALIVGPFLLAGLALAPARAADVPSRRSGLWEVNIKAAMGMNMTMQTCVDASKDRPDAMIAAQQARQQCDAPQIGPAAGGFHFHVVCHPSASMTMASDGEATGDFQSAYTVTSTMTMTPSPANMPAMTTTVAARYLGACTPDMQPGDMKMNGKVMHMPAKP